MNKQEIQDEIKGTRQKLERLEAKLNEPEKFEFQGGGWSVYTNVDKGFSVAMVDRPIHLQCDTHESCKRLAKHLNNSAIIWQVAEHVNDGWTRESGCISESCEVFYNTNFKAFDWDLVRYAEHGIFKNKEAAEKACEILNNQDTGYEK